MSDEELDNKLKEISWHLSENYSSVDNIGILSGLSGISLFFFYYAQYIESEKISDLGSNLLQRCIRFINNKNTPTTYFNGLVGFGWVLDHLEKENFVEINCDAIFYNLNDFIKESMVGYLKKKNYDFIHGATGYALFFLGRYRYTKSQNLKEKYKNILIDYIKQLHQIGEEDKETIKWVTTDFNTGNKIYNLGLSHGMASIVALLTKFSMHNDLKPYSIPILQKAINYMRGIKNEANYPYSFYPNSVPKEGPIEYKSRLAWCYGDLGIGITLLNAARILDDQELEVQSLFVLRHASHRKDYLSTFVDEPTLCHGAFGNALVYNQIHRNTNEEIFKNVSNYWFEIGYKMISTKSGHFKYESWNTKCIKWNSNYSLLMGISGIGLTIIDYLKNSPSNWNECLMI